MANFKQLALQYVLADDKGRKNDIVVQSATAIKDAKGDRVTVGGWVQSINSWMSAPSGDDMIDSSDAGSEGDIIARAKALEYLAGTLEELDGSVLAAAQVKLLVTFFGTLFTVDHKAGIMASAKALHQLALMDAFDPKLAKDIIENVAKLGDDFRLQLPTTRYEVYCLLAELLSNPEVANDLNSHYGTSAGLIMKLLELCSQEKDRENLMKWFSILTNFLILFKTTEDVDAEIFQRFSSYFPITLRAQAVQDGVTPDDLKLALRKCFSANSNIARLAFPFLIQRLDQGDAITPVVKADILQTINACVVQYDDVEKSIAPFTTQIWNSLKYEVRNGEIKETMERTLEVLRSVTQKLDGLAPQRRDDADLVDYCKLVLRDCVEDLRNPLYTAPAGQLLTSVLGATVRAFCVVVPPTLAAIREVLRPSMPFSHAKDIVGILRLILDARIRLIAEQSRWHQDDAFLLDAPSTELSRIFQEFLLPLWSNNLTEEELTPDRAALQEELIKGAAALLGQPSIQSGERASLLDASPTFDIVDKLLKILHRNLFNAVSTSPSGGSVLRRLDDPTVEALRTVAMAGSRDSQTAISALIDGFSQALGDPEQPGLGSADHAAQLQAMLLRIAYITCSQIPQTGKSLGNFSLFMQGIIAILHTTLHDKGNRDLAALLMSGITRGILYFRDACFERFGPQPGDSFRPDWMFDLEGTYISMVDPSRDTINPVAFPHIEPGKLPNWAKFQVDDHFTNKKAYVNFLKSSLLLVRALYLKATSVVTQENLPFSGGIVTLADEFASEEDDDPYILALSKLASTVISMLSPRDQEMLNLSEEAIMLFRANDSRVTGSAIPLSKGTTPRQLEEASQLRVRTPQNFLDYDHEFMKGRLTVSLTYGLLQNLHGVANSNKADISFRTILMMGYPHNLPDNTQRVFDEIMVVLSNRYNFPQEDAEFHVRTWVGNLDSAVEQISFLKDDTTTVPLEEALPKLSAVFGIVAGALARRDKYLDNILGLLRTATSHPRLGQWVARFFYLLVCPRKSLGEKSAALTSRFYKQWIYFNIAEPLLRESIPLKPKGSQSTNACVATMSILKALPLKLYANDVEVIARMALVAMDTLQGSLDTEAALAILLEIQEHAPKTLESRLKTLTEASIQAYKRFVQPATQEVYDPKVPQRFRWHCSRVELRKNTMVLLGRLPGKYEERHLLQLAPGVNKFLNSACNDPSREVRRLVRNARTAWFAVR